MTDQKYARQNRKLSGIFFEKVESLDEVIFVLQRYDAGILEKS